MSDEARERLCSSAKVLAATRRFWTTMGKGDEDTIAVAEYTMVHRLITKALAPELSDEDDGDNDTGVCGFIDAHQGVRVQVLKCEKTQ